PARPCRSRHYPCRDLVVAKEEVKVPDKFRKKPVVIKAVQFTEQTRDEIIAWTGCRHTAIDDEGADYETANLFIRTLEGDMMAKPGDWIIKGVQGEFYPCKDAIFRETYEPAM
ncbi:MAG: hypothetical protein AAGK66_08945, partial [Pseudomonadota bacterium]